MSGDLRVDFLGRRRQPLFGWSVFVAGALVLAWQATQLWQAHEALQGQRDGLARLERAAAGRAAPAMSAQDVQRHAQFERVARHLAVPWQALLDGVEGWGGSGVNLLRLTPDAENGRITLTAVAGSSELLGQYLLRLEQAPLLADVQLLRHERDAEGEEVEFDIEAGWLVRPLRETVADGGSR